MNRILFVFGLMLLTIARIVSGSASGNTGGKNHGTGTDPENRPVKVFILAGQSNAVGYNNIKELQSHSVDLVQLKNNKRLMFWPGSNARSGFSDQWTNLQTGVSDISGQEPFNEGCFGPEIGFGAGMHLALPDETIAIIKYAVGGTGIARSIDYSDYIPSLKGFDDKGRNWYPPVNGRPAGVLYQDLLANIHRALAALQTRGKDYQISGFLWMQGEHEAGISEKMAKDYGNLLALFRTSIRRDLHIKDLPFVIGEINSHSWAFGDTARKYQAMACNQDPGSLLIKTADLSRGSIGGAAHFDADGMMILGNRFAQGLLTILENQSQQTKTPEISFSSLLKELTDRTSVARWPHPAYRLLQASSYDRKSTEKDKEGWFANEDWSNYIRKEINNGREEFVLMDTEGPGAITRFWTGGHPNQKNNLRFYMDGQDTPFWETDHTGALIGQNSSIGIPLSQRSVDRDSLNINKGAQPGHNLYAPIPFEKRIKITSDIPKGTAGTGFWYNINYRIYTERVKVESFSQETPARYQEMLTNTNSVLTEFMNLAPLSARAPGENDVIESAFSLNHEESKTHSLTGPGAINRIRISLKAEDMNDAVTNTWICIDFDGKSTVEVPLGFFFGCGEQLVTVKNWYVKADQDGNMAAFWVMPFHEKAVIQLYNGGKKSISGTLEVSTCDWTWDSRSMYFHAAFKRLPEMPAKTTKDFNFIDLKDQSGVYAGDILQVYKNFQGWWGEGDEKIYVDGSAFPDHFGTGSEDYYGYAWGHPETFNNIFTGQPAGDANTGNEGTTVNSRVRSLDAIPFRKSFRFDMESWQLYGGTVNYSLACFWYAKEQMIDDTK